MSENPGRQKAVFVKPMGHPANADKVKSTGENPTMDTEILDGMCSVVC